MPVMAMSWAGFGARPISAFDREVLEHGVDLSGAGRGRIMSRDGSWLAASVVAIAVRGYR